VPREPALSENVFSPSDGMALRDGVSDSTSADTALVDSTSDSEPIADLGADGRRCGGGGLA
jgi:hypothetical protein